MTKESLTVVHDGVADQRLVSLHDLGDVAEAETVRALDPNASEVGRRDERRDVLDGQPLILRVDEPAGSGRGSLDEAQRRDPERVAGGLDDLPQGDLTIAELLRVDLHLELPIAVTPDRDVATPETPSTAARSSSAPARTTGSETVSLESETIMTRFVDESGWSICEGRETPDSATWDSATRSATTCRA